MIMIIKVGSIVKVNREHTIIDTVNKENKIHNIYIDLIHPSLANNLLVNRKSFYEYTEKFKGPMVDLLYK